MRPVVLKKSPIVPGVGEAPVRWEIGGLAWLVAVFRGKEAMVNWLEGESALRAGGELIMLA